MSGVGEEEFKEVEQINNTINNNNNGRAGDIDYLTNFRKKCPECFGMLLIIALIGVFVKIVLINFVMVYFFGNQNKQLQEFKKGPIFNLTSNETCPEGTEQVTVSFPGIEIKEMIVCKQIKIKEQKCEIYTVEYLGNANKMMSQVSFGKINNRNICYQRTEDSYATLLEHRDLACTAPQQSCGSVTLPDKHYCMNECVPNELMISQDLKDSSGNRILQSMLKSTGNLNITMNYHNSQNNPIQEIYIGLSKPCGDPTQIYSVRENKIVGRFSLLDVDTCTFDQFSNNKLKTDELYQFTGYEETELSVYSNNFEFEKDIEQPMPDEVKELFSANTFKIFYKLFNLWTKDCQAIYPARSFINVVANNWKNMSTASTYLVYAAFNYFVSICCYCFMLFLWFCWCHKWPNTSFSRIFLFLSYALYMIMNLLLVSNLFAIHSQISEIDGVVIADISLRQCSDGALQDTFDYMRINLMTDGYTWNIQIYVILAMILVSLIILKELMVLGYGIYRYRVEQARNKRPYVRVPQRI